MDTDPGVTAYLAKLPDEQQRLLATLRNRVAELVPDAVETITYQMPGFKLDGRLFLSYAAWKQHCSIYAIDDALLEKHAEAIRGYGRTKGALHFTSAKPLPDALLRDLVAQRIAEAKGKR